MPKSTHFLEDDDRKALFGHDRPWTYCGMPVAQGDRGRGEAEPRQIVHEDASCRMCCRIAGVAMRVPVALPKPHTPHAQPARRTTRPKNDAAPPRKTVISIFGIEVEPAPPMKPGIGPDCAKWRKKIARGEPLFKLAASQFTIGAIPRFGRELRPLYTVWRMRRKEYVDFSHGSPRKTTVVEWRSEVGSPIRVRCPTCHRPIRLSRWWDHGCEKAMVTTGEAFGDFRELTEGAAAPVYEDEVVSNTPPAESAQ